MKYLILIVFVFLRVNCFSQEFLIDLSQNPGMEQVRSVNPDETLKLKIINKIPGKSYSVSVIKENIPISEIELSNQLEGIATSGGGVARCAQFISSVMEIYEIENESDVPSKIQSIESEIIRFQELFQTGVDQDPNTGCDRIQIAKAQEIIRKTQQILEPYSLKAGQKLTVIVSTKDDSIEKKWISVFTTGQKGEFQVSYGFSFITQMISQENIFFTQQSGDTYNITREVNRRSLTFAPSIFFTWAGKKSIENDFNLSISGGIGFDLESPTVFLGPTISYNQNIKFHFGLAANKQYSLYGKYSEGQQLDEQLNVDQLHEKIYKLNPYFSLSIRLKDNPFQSTEN